MADYSVSAIFNAVDNMSGTVTSIGSNFASGINSMIQNSGMMQDAFAGMGEAATLAAPLVGALVAVVGTGIDTWVQSSIAMDGLAARTGASASDLATMKTQVDALFATGLVANFNDAANAVQLAHTRIKGLVTDGDMTTFLTESAGVAVAWGVSDTAVETTVAKLQGAFSDLQGSPITALDLLATTAQKSGLPLQNLDTIVSRLGPKFAGAGISALGMGGMIVLATQAGLSQQSLGGLATAIDKFHTSIIHPPKGFNKALSDLGLNSIVSDINSNKITMDTALDEIFTKLSAIKDPAQQSADAMALFGTNIAAFGGTDTLAKLQGFSDALGGDAGIAGAAKKAADIMQSDVQVQFDSITHQISLFAEGIVVSGVTAGAQLGVVIPYFVQQLGNTFETFVSTLSDKLTAFLNGAGNDITNWIDGAIGKITDFLGLTHQAQAAFAPGTTPASMLQAGGFQRALSGHAEGGILTQGLNIVGERGPEIIDGATLRVYPNGVAPAGRIASPAGSGGGGAAASAQGGGSSHIHFHLDGATVVDINAFMRQAYVAFQREDQRRMLRA